MTLKTAIPVYSLKDAALAAIKEAILANKLESGVMYAESTLANELGISRTPVREALIHLASQGLIVYFPRKGFQIRALAKKDVHNLFELRITLELAVMRNITPRLTPENLAGIEESLLLHLKASESGDPDKSVQTNKAFHLCLAYLTENNYLIAALEDIYDLIDLANTRSLEVDLRGLEAGEEHRRIFLELNRKNLSAVCEHMERHIRITEDRIISRITNAGV